MRSDNVTKGSERAPNRSLFYALGYTPEELDRPLIGVDEHTDGFIYMVSSAAITGAQKDFNAQKQAYFQRIADMPPLKFW